MTSCRLAPAQGRHDTGPSYRSGIKPEFPEILHDNTLGPELGKTQLGIAMEFASQPDQFLVMRRDHVCAPLFRFLPSNHVDGMIHCRAYHEKEQPMQYTRTMFEHMPSDASDEQIRLAAEGLERYHYEPFMILKLPFHHLKRPIFSPNMIACRVGCDIRRTDRGIGSTPAEVVKQLGMLLYHYGLLCRLRLGDAEDWDVVNEMYEDD